MNKCFVTETFSPHKGISYVFLILVVEFLGPLEADFL